MTRRTSGSNFDLTVENRVGLLLKIIGNNFVQPVKIIGAGFEVYTDKRSGTSGCRSSYKILNLSIFLVLT
jgi:hypothetical protein